jgi:hypothetical protein
VPTRHRPRPALRIDVGEEQTLDPLIEVPPALMTTVDAGTARKVGCGGATAR